MLNKTVRDLINSQINKEIYSSYLYYAIANFYRAKGLVGFTKWFDKQAQEELEHATKLNSYLYEQGEEVTLLAIDSPKATFKNVRDPLVAAYEHEKFISASINKIYSEALKVGDIRTVRFLNWFVDEQTEEEAKALELIEKYDLATKDTTTYLFDKEIGNLR